MKAELDRQCQITHEVLIHSPWDKKEFYTEWLAQTYYFLRHSTRIFCLAAGRMAHYQNVHHLYLMGHAKDERSQELLCEQDLRDFGLKASDFVESQATRALYAQIYYGITFENPLSVYGYILCFEGMAAYTGHPLGDRVREIYGEKKANRFLTILSQEDPQRTEKTIAMVDKLNPFEADQIYSTLQATFWLYRELVKNCSRDQMAPNVSADRMREEFKAQGGLQF